MELPTQTIDYRYYISHIYHTFVDVSCAIMVGALAGHIAKEHKFQNVLLISTTVTALTLTIDETPKIVTTIAPKIMAMMIGKNIAQQFSDATSISVLGGMLAVSVESSLSIYVNSITVEEVVSLVLSGAIGGMAYGFSKMCGDLDDD